MNRDCTYSAGCLREEPDTQVVGSPRLTSSAWLGPERTVTWASGKLRLDHLGQGKQGGLLNSLCHIGDDLPWPEIQGRIFAAVWRT